MNYVLAESISKAYGDQVLFEQIDLGINQGQKIGLIARNGEGKTSLLKVLAGLEPPDSGSIVIHKEIIIGLLEQEPHFKEGRTVFESIFHSSAPPMQAVKHYEYAVAQQEQHDTAENRETLQKAMVEMDRLKAWDYDVQIKQILTKLNIEELDKPVHELSGGQQKRLALARVLIEEPDFLILDEPTNHLDLEMIEWLENYLIRSKLTLLLVTHDRYFLDRITNEIIELSDGRLYKYKGNYAYYLEKKAEREFNKAREVEKAQSLMKKELEWIRRMPKARGTKNKARIESFYDLKDKASQKVADEALNFNIETQRMGSKVLELHKVSKSYGEKIILDKMSYKFKRKEKVGIVGNNGTGKTTFLRIITGEEAVDSGKVVIGDTIQFGHYKQEGIKINEDKRVIEVISDIADYVILGKNIKMSASQYLYHFNFSRDKQYTYVSKLSGGEKRRLYLMTVLMKRPNFLILDEPTNDLDLMTLNLLEDFLLGFDGTVVLVSHDRYFMDKIVDHLFVFEGDGNIRDFPGNYSQYRDAVGQEEKTKPTLSAAKNLSKEKSKTSIAEKKRLSYKEKLEYERLEGEIEELESKKAELTKQLNSGSLGHEELMSVSQELNNVIASINEKSDRWIELAAKLE